MWMDHLLLLTTEKSVSDIAAELGFASASHLGSLFKQQEGLTPRQYRLQQQPPAGRTGGGLLCMRMRGYFFARYLRISMATATMMTRPWTI